MGGGAWTMGRTGGGGGAGRGGGGVSSRSRGLGGGAGGRIQCRVRCLHPVTTRATAAMQRKRGSVTMTAAVSGQTAAGLLAGIGPLRQGARHL